MQSFFSALPYSRTLRQLGSIACAALFLAACSSGGGDGGGGTPPAAAPSVGRFVDSPVQGLHYTTSSGLSGITDANGQYNYRTGDTVIFDIGGVPINTVGVSADPVVTALSVFGATSTADPQVVNLSRLLLTLGGGAPNANNVIQLPATLPPLPSAINFNVPSVTFAANIAAAGGGTGPTLVSEATAITHLQNNFFAVSVTLAGSGSGSVASTPSGISCGATCSYVFSTATQITLTPTGSGFAGWSVGTGSATVCNGIPGACTFTPTSDSNITAIFNIPPPSTLTISNAGTGTGSVNCSINSGVFGPCAGPYADGTVIVLQATAISGSTFTGWTNGLGNATVCPNSPANCSFTLNTNTTVTANFVLNTVTQFSVTATTATGNGGGGTVLCNAGPCGSYPVNTLISVISTPNSASLFSGWSNGTGSVSANCSNAAGACTFTLTANTSITANFNRPTLNVIVGGAGAGIVNSSPTGIANCTTNCTASFDMGTAITLTASGAGFSGWSGGGCSGTGTCPITLNASTSVTATFGAVSAAPTFKFIGAPGRQLLAINPVSPGTPTPVKVGGVDVILGNPPTAAGTTLDESAGASVILSASYNSATSTVTNLQPSTLLFVSGGKVYKASPLVSDGVPGSLAANEPQQVSNVTNAVSCGTGSIHDVVNPNQVVGFNSPGQDGICNTIDDQIVGMHVNDSSGTAPVTLPAGTAINDTTVYSLTTGIVLHTILVTSAGDLQWMDNTFVPTAITNGTGIGPVTVVAEQSDKVFLTTPTKLYIYQPSTHTLTATPVVTADPSTVFVNSDDNPADLNNIFLVQSDGAVYKVPLSTTPGTTITTKHFVALAGTVVANTKLSSGKIIIATGINPSGQFGFLNPCYTATPRSCNNGIIAVDKVTGASTTIEVAASQKAIFLNRSFNNYVLYTRNDPATAGISDGALLRIEDASNPAVLVGQNGGWAGVVSSTSVSLVSITSPTIKQVFSQSTNVGPPALGTVSVISSPTGSPVSLGAVAASPSVTNMPFFFGSSETTMIGRAFLEASPGNYQPFFIDTALGNSLTPVATPGAPAQWVEIRD